MADPVAPINFLIPIELLEFVDEAREEKESRRRFILIALEKEVFARRKNNLV